MPSNKRASTLSEGQGESQYLCVLKADRGLLPAECYLSRRTSFTVAKAVGFKVNVFHPPANEVISESVRYGNLTYEV